jgi:hypothetical protein
LLSHTIRRRAISAVLAASAVAILAPAAVFATEPTTPACPDTHWPAAVQGKPTNLKAGARGGDYFWHDKNGWHLRVTHAGTRKVVFTGKIVSSTPIKVTGVLLEKKDAFTLSADKKTLTYKFNNYGHIDGLNFTTACAQHLSIRGSMAGKKLPVTRIWLGVRHVHPLSNRFVVVKVV